MQLLASVALAGDWFSTPLAYWENSPYGASEEGGDEGEEPKEASEERFDWSDYADPASATFWREGQHVPPAPLLELIREPSQENIERYRQWTQQKLEVSAWVSGLLAQTPSEVSWEGVKVVYFYASSCGYCKENTPHVLELVKRGADVMPVHLDLPSPAYPNSTPFTPEMGEFVVLHGTPTWVLVAQGRRRTVHGFADVDRLQAELRVLLEGER